jgi:hypothetical protein
MNYAFYDLETGEIKSCQTDDNVGEGYGVLYLDIVPMAYISLYYVEDGDLVLRPVTSVVLDGDTITFSNPHPDAIATIRNVDGEEIEFVPQPIKLTDSGFYRISMPQPFPYRNILEHFEYA